MTLRPIQGAPPGAPNPDFPTTGPVARRGRPDYVPTDEVRERVEIMVAGGCFQEQIARAVGIDEKTLRKHYREELDSGKVKVDAMVVSAHLEAIKRGDSMLIKWWEQSRMGWRGEAREDGAAPDQSMRVVVEFKGEAAPGAPTIEHRPQDDDRDREALRRNVQLIG